MVYKIPDSGFAFGSPQIYVEVYPNSGSGQSDPNTISNTSYVITGGYTGILSATIQKNIRDDSGGKFSITLPPGGPNGPNDPITWTNIITPLSLIMIGLKRGNSSRIVMVGLVTTIIENQEWRTGDTVLRVINIQGVDFTYYFTAFSYFTLSYLGYVVSNTQFSLAGFLQTMEGQQLQGPVVENGYDWLTAVMLGTPSGTPSTLFNTTQSIQPILANTSLWFRGSKFPINTMISYWFEAFTDPPATAGGTTAYIPLLTDFLQSEGSWMEKFKTIFPWPYYEFFVITASPSDYPDLTSAAAALSSGVGFGFLPGVSFNFTNITGFNSVYPTIIARVNPLPWASIDVQNANPQYTDVRWKGLPTFSLGTYGFISSTVNCSVNELSNFFIVNTMESEALMQNANAAATNAFAAELIGTYFSPHSINQYGFHSTSLDIKWLSVLSPNSSSQFFNNLNFYSRWILGKLASYYIPSPYMFNGDLFIPMWPDVMPGCRFVYHPFKNQAEYMFYIEGVEHTYNFGGICGTRLQLSRGLLHTDWQSETLMQQLHLDQVDKVNGKLVARTNVTSDPGIIYRNISGTTTGTIGNPMLSPTGAITTP